MRMASRKLSHPLTLRTEVCFGVNRHATRDEETHVGRKDGMEEAELDRYGDVYCMATQQTSQDRIATTVPQRRL